MIDPDLDRSLLDVRGRFADCATMLNIIIGLRTQTKRLMPALADDLHVLRAQIARLLNLLEGDKES